jgi:hypothetical protein
MLTRHLRINDAATAKPTAARLRITGPDGTFFAPFGRFAEFATGRGEDVGGQLLIGREKSCYIDGSCEVPLPAGVPLRVQATKGPEYRPLDESVTLGPGQMALRFTIDRWSDLRAEGWHPGDSRCHDLTPHAALLEAAAEDLDVINLLAREQPRPSHDGTAYPAAPNLIAFSGQAPALEAHGRLVAVNTLNTHPSLGKVGLLYSHRPVYPLAFGGDSDDWSLCDWCDQCHRKGGLTVWADAFRPTGGLTGGEALIAAILGKVDAIEIDAEPRKQPLLPWIYRLWDAGMMVPLVGGSGKDSNRTPLGAVRTYARISDEPLTYKAWIAAVRAGRSFITSGPLLAFSFEGTTAKAMARSLAPFDRLDIVANGEVIGTIPSRFDDEEKCYRAELEAAFTGPGWVTARCHSTSGAFAHAQPIAVGEPSRRPEAIAALANLVEETRNWIGSTGRFQIAKRKQRLLDLCAEAAARLT